MQNLVIMGLGCMAFAVWGGFPPWAPMPCRPGIISSHLGGGARVREGCLTPLSLCSDRRIWMLFSLYYGMDLTKGFLSMALTLMDATIQDLQRLPELLVDNPVLQVYHEDPAVL
jgi:hypothetical protein